MDNTFTLHNLFFFFYAVPPQFSTNSFFLIYVVSTPPTLLRVSIPTHSYTYSSSHQPKRAIHFFRPSFSLTHINLLFRHHHAEFPPRPFPHSHHTYPTSHHPHYLFPDVLPSPSKSTSHFFKALRLHYTTQVWLFLHYFPPPSHSSRSLQPHALHPRHRITPSESHKNQNKGNSTCFFPARFLHPPLHQQQPPSPPRLRPTKLCTSSTHPPPLLSSSLRFLSS